MMEPLWLKLLRNTISMLEKERYEIIRFENEGISLDVSVSPEEGTIWLNREQMAILFGRDTITISKHINNVLSEECKGSTVSKIATVQKEGELDKNTSMQKMHKSQNSNNPNYRPPVFYNLDVIISAGYRVKSQRGVAFRRWANSILKQYLLKRYVINEDRLTLNESNINELK